MATDPSQRQKSVELYRRIATESGFPVFGRIIFSNLYIWGDIHMMTIQETLRLFGITRCYKGFLHTAYAIQLAVEDENRLEAVTKEIYMETAFHFNCTWTAVERNIRTAVARAWKINHALLCDMAGYPLTCAPTASEFIEIIASYILRSSQLQLPLRPLVML